MNKFVNLIVILICIFNLNTAYQGSSIIFPGQTSSSKYNDDYRNTYTDQPPRRIISSTDISQDWNVNRNINRNNDNRPIEPKNNRNKNNLNSIDKNVEESRINERFKSKGSSLDDLPYDFSKTDKIHKVSDLLRFLGIEEKSNDEDGLMVRKSNDDPSQVSCHSELRTIDLALELKKNNDDFKVFPECVKAKRCAGCCGFNSGKQCLPTKIEKINVNAAVIRVKRSCDDSSCSAEIDKSNVRKVFQIDSHEECSCRCASNGDVCTENQEWEESTCKCICKDNENLKSMCEQNSQKSWNDKECKCNCQKVLKCSTGLVFSHKTCSCARKGQ